MTRRFVLMDRDGTLNVERDHITDESEIELIPGAVEAIHELRALGLGLVVITNQAHVGRGFLTPAGLETIHARLVELLAAGGATLDAIYVCPHPPEDGCGCRKPKTGLVERAAAEHGFEPARAFVVGDHAGDMEMGRAIGATTILVTTGHGAEQLDRAGGNADHVATDLLEAATIIRGLVEGEAPG